MINMRDKLTEIYWAVKPRPTSKYWANRNMADGYWANRNHPSKIYIAELISELPHAESILEVGCSCGIDL